VPELPEVETIRRNLQSTALRRTIRRAWLSGLKLRERVAPRLATRLRGRTLQTVDRHGKYLLLRLSGDLTLLSHLGMSGRWLFFDDPPVRRLPHVHLRVSFTDGSELWYQDPRRFGLLRLVANARLSRDPALRQLGPDPIAEPAAGATLYALAEGARVAVKMFLLDQKRVAGLGNIYASEILHRAGVDPRRRAGTLSSAEWNDVARQVVLVLGEAIERLGTTFSTYRTLWNEPGAYGDQLLVYDRAGEPCRRCRTPIRRIVQGQRSTFYCPSCQSRRGQSARKSRSRATISVARGPSDP
jgi:formamidopyrimidine-DNA glycosylase